MSQLRLEPYSMPAADLGVENPLPALFFNDEELHAAQEIDAQVPADMLENMRYGHLPNILPYAMQDGYNREKRPRDFRAAVLENDILRATFLPELGGRLWSLIHKPTGRELLYVNSGFQPANLALRNAWFSGGVEWNIGTIGHTPFTCSPLFAARLQRADGTPVLRMYEWERIRQVTYQIDAWLPDDSSVLFVRVSILNPRREPVPMYWWSNIAVPENPATRVLVPAESAYRYNYKQLRVIPVPVWNGRDNSYPAHSPNATDFFFHIPENRLPWIAALDETGKGLVQVSTSPLMGRKLFVWGAESGGRRWQEFLSEPGQAYFEIQSGLARTQLEHLPMPAKTRWTWLEAYGLLSADLQVHGADWQAAITSAADALENLIPRAQLERELCESETFADVPPADIFQLGSGWGALEGKRLAATGKPALTTPGLVFADESLGDLQQPWLDLLTTGAFPTSAPNTLLPGFLVQDEWQSLLETSPNAETNWLAQLHLGIMCHYRRDFVGARRAWETAQSLTPSAWALRNLAILDGQEQNFTAGAEKYLQACRLQPNLFPLMAECGRFLVEHGFAQEWLELLNELPETVRRRGRICLLEAQAALAAGQLDRAGQIIQTLPVIEEFREGETSLTNLWFDYHAQRLSQQTNRPVDDTLRAEARVQFPLPAELDFRMNTTGEE